MMTDDTDGRGVTHRADGRRSLGALLLPRSPRVRKARMIFYICIAIGMLAGAFLALADPSGGKLFGAFFDGGQPMSGTVALTLVAVTAIGLYLSIRYHALLDEHERAAYDFGHVAALYVYFTVSIVWWILAKAQLAPPVDGMTIFMVTIAVLTLVWLLSRLR